MADRTTRRGVGAVGNWSPTGTLLRRRGPVADLLDGRPNLRRFPRVVSELRVPDGDAGPAVVADPLKLLDRGGAAPLAFARRHADLKFAGMLAGRVALGGVGAPLRRGGADLVVPHRRQRVDERQKLGPPGLI